MKPWLVPFLLVTTVLSLTASVLSLSHGQVMPGLLFVFNTLFFAVFLVGAWQEAKKYQHQAAPPSEEKPTP
ncbi:MULTISPECIES: hypothetical protein [Nocardiopsis]|uniref:Uncharacterized protein n=1 Tax=Nocardiopsis dassonvillei (strain ATCC 23218 / DSM 43111 / CIP 107115 / JCM 7437 / KCTC 9190 / NBRC 14626 / NCTC 10488 / NRRL B-5397 / IMRU 509) TaxID=446468 RepID=D7B912_NOCDD|nr:MULTISPECIES: hypothetical protein [Nocardiopsis]ADH70670.1 hypothetical protein Ndas_5290 [Nocardiopsis dassonvillei subsp. dassonvillei DSM 43111]NKY77917.1 hypothetical protein [Nocardiopsis dassonvillei]VEI90879.1 Uncharacterised protein [Nocardiopsis dassonvillei]